MRKRRIAILMHEEDDEDVLEKYLISRLAEYWREAGHEVIFLFGTEHFVPADLLFVHVDLSVVPESYRAFADRYPVAINDRVKDIRKSTFSQGLLQPGDSWDGPVVVKTDNNAAGYPEHDRPGLVAKVRQKLISTMYRLELEGPISLLRTTIDYPVYDHLQEVPYSYFYNPSLIVQKFIPEKEEGLYCVRYMEFLGDHITCTRLKGEHPIVKRKNAEVVEVDIEPHPEIVAMRDRLGVDYGKFDYVVTGGEAILLDVNKTVGYTPSVQETEERRELRRYRAEGLYDFFEERAPATA